MSRQACSAFMASAIALLFLPSLAELILAKQCNGPTGSVTLTFNTKLTRFSNHYVGPESYESSRGRDDVVPF